MKIIKTIYTKIILGVNFFSSGRCLNVILIEFLI